MRADRRVDLRDRQLPVRDQGHRGTCVAFAASAGHETACHDGEVLCVEFLHWAAKRRDGLPKNAEGTTLVAAAEALAKVGQPPESAWPYDDGRDQRAAGYCPPHGACTAARARRLERGTAMSAAPAALRSSLDAEQAVLLGVRLYATWHNVAPDGLIEMPASGAADLGGHAVLVVGYRDGEGAGGGRFIIKNSWGRGWGDDGYGYLPYAYVAVHGVGAMALGRRVGRTD